MKSPDADSPIVPQPPKSTATLLAMAISMEREAAARYDELAREMASSGNPELADLFDELGAEERRHEAHILAWGVTPADLSKQAEMKWRSPEAPSQEDSDAAGGVHLMTPHRALSLAVHNEERAFAFFSNIAALADTAEVRERAESLAKEELAHVVRLRVERRRAWRAQTERAVESAPKEGVLSLRSLPALVNRALSVEREAATRCAEFADTLEAGGDTKAAEELRKLALDISAVIAGLENRAGENAQTPGTGHTAQADLDVLQNASPQGVLSLALADAEDALDFYLAVGDAGATQDMMETAQELAQHALDRFNRIKSLLGNT
ncbi:MAG: ferritin family protein [Rhodospirillaceae bacterium]|jgi:rubrerythrin|nr:ferritin family protein [Rhodospirillaceae bacterium]MBT5674077.1 ferritin family protein [Rhodospirillaceae bacterium]MBT5781327.1 ferritin family protein [Rhodospirillaceae bacterium]